MTRLFLSAMLIRLVVALLSPGTGDSENFIAAANAVLHGANVYNDFSTYNYPPVYAWLLAGSIALTDHLGISQSLAVKFLPILGDSSIVFLIVPIAMRWHPTVALQLGWLYALNPLTILIAAHHGHFDSLAILPVVFSIYWTSAGFAFVPSALALGLGGALKIVPGFTGLAWFADLRGPLQWAVFAALVGTPVALALAAGYFSSPVGFTENVVQHRAVVDGGWGIYFPILGIEQIAKRYALTEWLQVTYALRAFNRIFLIAGLMLTAYWTRARPFAERLLLSQLALQVLSGRWAAEYTAWLVPIMVLSNQRGFAVWGIVSFIWMMLVYVLFAAPEIYHDNLNRVITLFGAPYWMICAVWFWSNLKQHRNKISRWMTQPLLS